MDLANEGDETTSLVGAYDEYYQMGVRSLMEKENIKKVPNKYILSEAERPNYNLEINNTNLINLPVIDFAQLQASNRSLVINSLAKACQDYGFFQLVNHGIKGDVIDRMKDASKRFFELPSSERSKYMSNDMCSPVRYGTSFNQNNDKVYCWRDFLKLSCHPALSQNFPHHWPSSPLDLSEEGSQIVVMNWYPACPEPELTLGMPPHSDYGLLTLLLQDEQVEGLQIQHQGTWLNLKPIPNSFVVNVGDHLEVSSC
uniref:Fe2OG dioxygenase domain-containing protein n=1 Tax=Cannabis sativa TaxID=3483 RepID=A0A803NWN8_CANSA